MVLDMGDGKKWNQNGCLGHEHPAKPHHPTYCYQILKNAGMMGDWNQSKHQTGEWIEYPRGGQGGRGGGQASYTSRGYGSQSWSNFPVSDELQSAFRNLRLEDRNVSCHAGIHGRYSCSAKLRRASHSDQCLAVGL